MGASTVEAAALLDLLGRIHAAPDVTAGLAAVLEFVRVDGAPQAGVLLDYSGELRGLLAASAGEPREHILSRKEAGEVLRSLETGDVLRAENGASAFSGASAYSVVPLPGPTGPYGVLLLAIPADEDPGRFERLAAHAGPALFHRVEAERLHRRSASAERQHQLLAAIVDTIVDPVLVTDASGTILLENRQADTLFRSDDSDGHERVRAAEINNLLLSSFLARGFLDGEDAVRELTLVDASHGDRLFEVVSAPLPAEPFGAGRVLSVLRDVTELRRAANELEHQFNRVRTAEIRARQERDRLNLILEHVGDPIVVTDKHSDLVLMNREAERLFALTSSSAAARASPAEIRRNDERLSTFVAELARTREASRVADLELTDPDTGASFPAELVAAKILGDGGELNAIVSIVHDLTEVVENERLASQLAELNAGLEGRVRLATEELEERNRRLEWQSHELERAYRLKSEFLASMSHELRTPINALVGYASLMRDRIYGDLTEHQEEALERMHGASNHLLELVTDVLDLAKIEAGKMPVHVERVEVPALLDELSRTVQPLVRAKELEYVLKSSPDIPALQTDRTKVKQIILNLLSNAIKFTRHGTITVEAAAVADGTGMEISVADTGIGIPPEHSGAVFEDFRQVDQSWTREHGGTGLGLSIVKKLLALLGGTIRVESVPGQGSTFTVFLPLQSEELHVHEEVARLSREDESVVLPGRTPG